MKTSSERNNENNHSIKILNSHEEDNLEKNVVWVFGIRRSGTTWLAKELLSYNTVLCDEPWIGGHFGVVGLSGERTYDKNQIRKNYFFNNSFKSTWNYFLRKLILQRIHAEFQDTNRKIIIKEPNGSLAADIISEAMPNSKFILVIRDCRDNIDSVLNGMKKGGWRAKWQGKSISEDERMEFIKKEANVIQKTWEILLKAYNNHEKSLKYKIRYEDLRKNTLLELRKLYQFLEITIDEENLQKLVDKFSFENIPQDQKGEGKSKRSATPGLWGKNFSSEEILAINKVLEPTLIKLGYC